MSSYKLKEIALVPTSKELVDIVLSNTQKKTPTQCHKQFAISRIRKFYMRKVKFVQQTYHDHLTNIIKSFPRLDDIHPFYADLFNIQYDRDHYKIALSRITVTRGIIDKLAADYVKLLKFADSLFKCKKTKVAALGRMTTMIKKCDDELKYLEEVRQHMSRIPSINPSTRTLILTGYPNVGKSSFMNKTTQANVDVQSYSFTTRSLYVGHFEYKSTKWQVIDTPGLLDRPLPEKNTIELTAITALTHIQASILYFLDPSEECGYKLEEQVKLFHSIKVLFRDQPIVIVINKTDIKPIDSLTKEQKELIDSMTKDVTNDVTMVHCSAKEGLNVAEARDKACDSLLAQLVGAKATENKLNSIRNQLTVIQPVGGRNPARTAVVPNGMMGSLAHKTSNNMNEDSEEDSEEMTAVAIQEANGGVGVYQYDNRKNWTLDNPDHAYDAIPEILNGKNIADFVDPEILEKVAILQREEDELQAAWEAADKDDLGYIANQGLREELFGLIKSKQDMKRGLVGAKGRKMAKTAKTTIDEQTVLEGLSKHGYQTEGVLSRSKEFQKTTLMDGLKDDDESVESLSSDEEGTTEQLARKVTKRTKAFQRLRVRGDLGEEKRIEKNKSNRLALGGLHTEKDKVNERIVTKAVRQKLRDNDTHNRQGEGDKRIHNAKPRHLYAGKRALQSSHR